MKKMKLFAATAMIAMVATAGYFGYSAYEYINMTDAERMMKANLEALTTGEDPDEVTCVEDRGDTCLVGSTPVQDYDEKESWW